jgi:uncharacterized protein (TIGR02172 family)
MAYTSYQENNLVATIGLIGHIDSSNAETLEQEIQALRKEHPNGSLLLDAAKLEYISSAGLRVILRLSQSEEGLKIINVSSEVYEVFEMTGFSQMIPIEKAYRTLSVEGCEVIGQGSNGKVYRLDPETIIKVYNDPDSLPEIKRETDLARKAFVLGIPTAIPYDVVRVGKGYGSVFELLNATSFSKLISAEPEKIDTYVALYVDLLKKIHATHVKAGEMPRMKDVAIGWADYLKDYLPSEQAQKLMKLVAETPERDTMIHGDYHTKNVLMQKGEVLLIDMDTLSMGHPVFEFASMYLGFVGFGETDPASSAAFMGLPYPTAGEFFHKAVRLYLGDGSEERAKALEAKATIVGSARLLRRTLRRDGAKTPEGRAIIAACEKHLAELLPQTDSLDF